MAMERTQERTNNEPFTFEIVEHLAVIAVQKNGWSKELNLVSWNGQQPPKFDIREWSADHTRMKRGITLYDNEMRKASQAYLKFCNARKVSEGRFNRNAAAEAGIRAGEEAAHAQEEAYRDAIRTKEEANVDAGSDTFAALKDDTAPGLAGADAEVAAGADSMQAAAVAAESQALAQTEEAPF